MRFLTLPLRLFWVTLTVLIVFGWLSHGMVESVDMQAELERMEREQAVKAKIQEMGPRYYYRILHSGMLQVNKYSGDDLDKRWKRLRLREGN